MGIPWAVFGHDHRHTGLSQNTLNTVSATVKWKFEVGNIVPFTPVVGSDGTIYSGSYNSPNGILHAINPDGTLKWQYSTTEMCNTASPAIDKNGVIYIGTMAYNQNQGNNHLWAINPDGTKKWAFEVPKVQTEGINIGDDGTIYFGAGGIFYALSPTGIAKWTFAPGSDVWGTPTIADDGTIYITTQSGSLIALTSDGSKKWEHPLGHSYPADPTVNGDGTVYAYGDGLYALNTDGTVKWKWPSIYYASGPSIGPDGTLYLTTDGGALLAFFPNGTLKWKSWVFNRNLYDLKRPLVDSSGIIYYTVNDENLSKSYVVAVNSNGSQEWVLEVPGATHFSTPAMGEEGILYIGSHDQNIYAIGGPERKGPPTPPRNVAVIPGDGYVDITWSKPKSLGGSIQLSYVVMRGTSAGSTAPLATVDGTTTTYHDAAVTNGNTYYYNIKAKNEYGDSDLAFDGGKEPSAVPQKDVTPPTISIDNIVNGTELTYRKSMQLSGNASDNIGISKIEVSTDGKNWKTASGTAFWVYNLNLTQGENVVYVKATDYSGNNITKSVKFKVKYSSGGDPVLLGSPAYLLFSAIVIIALVSVVALFLMMRRKRARLKDIPAEEEDER